MNDLISRLRAWTECGEQLIYEHHLDAPLARMASVPYSLPPGYTALYSHQAEATHIALSGHSCSFINTNGVRKDTGTNVSLSEDSKSEARSLSVMSCALVEQ